MEMNTFMEQIKGKACSAKNWCVEHQKELMVYIPIGVSFVTEVIKIASKNASNKEARRLKDNYIYDRSHGHYYELSHKLNSSEHLMIDMRRDNGESLPEILSAMDVLKK